MDVFCLSVDWACSGSTSFFRHDRQSLEVLRISANRDLATLSLVHQPPWRRQVHSEREAVWDVSLAMLVVAATMFHLLHQPMGGWQQGQSSDAGSASGAGAVESPVHPSHGLYEQQQPVTALWTCPAGL